MPQLRQKLEKDHILQNEKFLLYKVVERKNGSQKFFLQESSQKFFLQEFKET